MPGRHGDRLGPAPTDHVHYDNFILARPGATGSAPFDGGHPRSVAVGCATMNRPSSPAATPFSSYQKVVVGMLAFLQFAVILDFMLMSPLGAVIMPALSITPAQFGTVVSAYAFAAGT